MMNAWPPSGHQELKWIQKESGNLVEPKNPAVASKRETWIIVIAICTAFIVTWFLIADNLNREASSDASRAPEPAVEVRAVTLDNVPLATGDEPVEQLFKQSGCPVCHTIPGISGAQGRECPKLVLGTTASQRLADPQYTGTAATDWEYIMESILNPAAYVVPGYSNRTMPPWYGKKLSATALDKMTRYLIQIKEVSDDVG